MCDKIEHPERVNLLGITKVVYANNAVEYLMEGL